MFHRFVRNVSAAVVAYGLAAPVASAHGIGQRIDLPVPASVYALGGAAVVLASFVLVSIFFVRSFDRTAPTRTVRVPDALATGVSFFLRAFFVAAIVLTVLAGWYGSPSPETNIAPTMLWLGLGVIMTYVTVFMGNVWQEHHPVAWLMDGLRRIGIFPRDPLVGWPMALASWVAVSGYVLFRWVENVTVTTSDPRHVAVYAAAYVVLTACGMAVFGTAAWLRFCDPFSVCFRLIGMCSLFHVHRENDGVRLGVRWPGAGLLRAPMPHVSEALFLLTILATVSFDGLFSTPFGLAVHTAIRMTLHVSTSVAKTIELGLVIALFSALYGLCCACMTAIVGTSRWTFGNVFRLFALSLLPIAIAYEMVHYVTLLLIETQRFIALASDPLGIGWNLFGTAGRPLWYGIVNFRILWNVEVAVIVLGHIAAVVAAHVTAMRRLSDHRLVVLSQLPMLLLMVAYTGFGLWLIAAPIATGGH